jgi:hypothetical protein
VKVRVVLLALGQLAHLDREIERPAKIAEAKRALESADALDVDDPPFGHLRE